MIGAINIELFEKYKMYPYSMDEFSCQIYSFSFGDFFILAKNESHNPLKLIRIKAVRVCDNKWVSFNIIPDLMNDDGFFNKYILDNFKRLP